jgi:KaiC/GvpD/RAD55 family RecA-like ATPase
MKSIPVSVLPDASDSAETAGNGGTPASPRTGEARIPTGIADFDFLSGGLPAGSLVLLQGESGAGHHEFALTSAAHLLFGADETSSHRFYLGAVRGTFVYPRGLSYVSLSRSRDQLLREVASAFDPTYAGVLERHLVYHDLSPAYFADSVVPPGWASKPRPLLADPAPVDRSTARVASLPEDPLTAVARAVEADGEGNLVIVDSLTDLLVRRAVDGEALLTLVKGLRRRAKDWNGLVYLLLSRGVAPPEIEHALADSVDGVLTFSWTMHPNRSSRQRTMLVEKFLPVLAHMPHEQHGRFVVRVGSLQGLITTQYERI